MDKSIGVCRVLIVLGLMTVGVVFGLLIAPLTVESQTDNRRSCAVLIYKVADGR
ncbi:hypothetical protein D3C76_1785420 [compost metagenome]